MKISRFNFISFRWTIPIFLISFPEQLKFISGIHRWTIREQTWTLGWQPWTLLKIFIFISGILREHTWTLGASSPDSFSEHLHSLLIAYLLLSAYLIICVWNNFLNRTFQYDLRWIRIFIFKTHSNFIVQKVQCPVSGFLHFIIYELFWFDSAFANIQPEFSWIQIFLWVFTLFRHRFSTTFSDSIS